MDNISNEEMKRLIKRELKFAVRKKWDVYNDRDGVQRLQLVNHMMRQIRHNPLSRSGFRRKCEQVIQDLISDQDVYINTKGKIRLYKPEDDDDDVDVGMNITTTTTNNNNNNNNNNNQINTSNAESNANIGSTVDVDMIDGDAGDDDGDVRNNNNGGDDDNITTTTTTTTTNNNNNQINASNTGSNANMGSTVDDNVDVEMTDVSNNLNNEVVSNNDDQRIDDGTNNIINNVAINENDDNNGNSNSDGTNNDNGNEEMKQDDEDNNNININSNSNNNNNDNDNDEVEAIKKKNNVVTMKKGKQGSRKVNMKIIESYGEMSQVQDNPRSDDGMDARAALGFSEYHLQLTEEVLLRASNGEEEFKTLASILEAITDTRNHNLTGERKLRNQLYDWLSGLCRDKGYTLNLGSPPSLSVQVVAVLNYAPISCIDYVDRSDEKRANKMKPANPCVRLVIYTLARSMLRDYMNRNDRHLQTIDDVLKDLESKIALVDRFPFIVKDKNNSESELDKFMDVIKLDKRFSSLIPAILVALKGMRFVTNENDNNNPLFRLIFGAAPRDLVRGIPAKTNLDVKVKDGNACCHPECMLNRSYLRNPFIFPIDLLKLLQHNVWDWYMHISTFSSFVIENRHLSDEEPPPNTILRWADRDGGNDQDLDDLIEPFRRSYGSRRETDWQLEMQGYRKYGSGNETEYQLQRRREAAREVQFGSGNETEAQRRGCRQGGLNARRQRDLVRATTDEHATEKAELMGKTGDCIMCLHDIINNTMLRGEVHRMCKDKRIEDPNFKANLFLVKANTLYADGTRVIQEMKGGCVACDLHVCKKHWEGFDCADCDMYKKFAGDYPMINYRFFGRTMYYNGYCPECNIDKYSGDRAKYRKCKLGNCERGTNLESNDSKMGEELHDRKRKRCVCTTGPCPCPL